MAICPRCGCDVTFSVPDDSGGFRVRCSRCKADLSPGVPEGGGRPRADAPWKPPAVEESDEFPRHRERAPRPRRPRPRPPEVFSPAERQEISRARRKEDRGRRAEIIRGWTYLGGGIGSLVLALVFAFLCTEVHEAGVRWRWGWVAAVVVFGIGGLVTCLISTFAIFQG